ncbi:MAG: hypothetical protein HOV80_26335 [Polyangiaceae bacterium]|nr:hypothetical protein [Polyangiaceae bacterium]
MTARALFSIASACIVSVGLVACGGRPVGDEGYFAGEPLPPPEKSKAKPAAASASAEPPSSAAVASASAAPVSTGPSCDTPPPGGFPNCNKDATNAPCISAGIGECFLKCTSADSKGRSVPCPQARPM